MKENSGRVALIFSLGLLFYLLSPPLVYKASQVSGIPLSEKAFMTIYAPLIPLIENVPPYAWLIQTEAEFLRLD